MRTKRHLNILTLVRATVRIGVPICTLITVASQTLALPSPPQPDLDVPAVAETKAPGPRPESIVIDSIDITPAPEPLTRQSGTLVQTEYFYAYRQSLSSRVGMMAGMSEGAATSLTGGFQYWFTTSSFKTYEIGTDLVGADGTGRVHASQRWIFSKGRFRPHLKAGLGVQIVPRDGLTTALKPEHYQLRGAFGFERLLVPPLSLRMELDLAAGVSAVEGLFTVGCAWGW